MNRLIRKRYLALVKGCPPEQGIIDQPIGRKSDFETSEIYVLQIIHPNGKLAKTKFQRLETRIFRDHPVSLIEIELLTGRMHQIRVHFQHIGYPVIGDKLYGPDTKFYLQVVESGWHPSMIDQLYIRRQALHASYLEFEWQGKIVSFNSPLPDDLQKFWDSCTPA